MSAITISNLKITPYTQKDDISKIVFGDNWTIKIKLPTAHQTGDRYAIGIDFENVLYPPNRPLCAGTETFILNGDELSFDVPTSTTRLRDWCSRLRKPSSLVVQIVRLRNSKSETLMLDTILALPSIMDGAVHVCEGDAIKLLLDAKIDKPVMAGSAGQYLSLDAEGRTIWSDIEITSSYATIDYVDSSVQEARTAAETALILHDESESAHYTLFSSKANLSDLQGHIDDTAIHVTSTEKTAWNAKADAATTLAGYGITDAYDRSEADETFATWSGTEEIAQAVEELADEMVDHTTNSNIHTTSTEKTKLAGIEDGAEVNVQVDWDESDSTEDAFIKNKPSIPSISGLATVTYVDSAVSLKLDNPSGGTAGQVLTKTASGEAWSDVEGYDEKDYLCFDIVTGGKILLYKMGGQHNTLPPLDIEYSKDKKNWTTYTWRDRIGSQIPVQAGDKLFFRGNNPNGFSIDQNAFYSFNMSDSTAYATGNIMSLLDKSCNAKDLTQFTSGTNKIFYGLFYGCTGLLSVPSLTATTLSYGCYESMFASCTGIKTFTCLPVLTTAERCFYSMFIRCSSLEYVELPKMYSMSTSTNAFYAMFGYCTALKHVKVGFTEWWNGYYFLDNANGIFECPVEIDMSQRTGLKLPSKWTVVQNSKNPTVNHTALEVVDESESSSFSCVPSGENVVKLSVSTALTINATISSTTMIAYSELILDIAAGATVTAGTNLTFVDTPEVGKRNICICRWSGGVCKLYVVLTEDIN